MLYTLKTEMLLLRGLFPTAFVKIHIYVRDIITGTGFIGLKALVFFSFY